MEAQTVRIIRKLQQNNIGAVCFALNFSLPAIPKPHWLQRERNCEPVSMLMFILKASYYANSIQTAATLKDDSSLSLTWFAWYKNDASYVPPVTSQRVWIPLSRLQLRPLPRVTSLRLLCTCTLYLSPKNMHNSSFFFLNRGDKVFWPAAVNRGLTELLCFPLLCWIFLSSLFHFQMAIELTKLSYSILHSPATKTDKSSC